MIRSFRGKSPAIDPSAFIAETAAIIGDVAVGPQSSIWYGAVLRGDVYHIRIGARTSIQDNSVVHVTHDRYATIVGDDVTVGHGVILHGCIVHNFVLVGMGAILLDQAEIGDHSIVGAGALVTPGTKIPPGHLAVGSPARVKRPLTDDELDWIEGSAAYYANLAETYRTET